MSPDPEKPPEYQTATVELAVSGTKLRLEMSVTAAPTRPVQMLPLYRSVADSLVHLAVKSAESEGAKVSCQRGCGACCRQLVPISEIEARLLRDLVNEMPESRRSEIRARFDAGRRRLHDAGLLGKLLEPETFTDEEFVPFGMEYFTQGIPCPFLEEESCSIYEERPIACREYLVTSPAKNCASPAAETVRCVNVPAKVSKAISCTGSRQNPASQKWVPLLLACEWAETHSDECRPRPGTELVRDFFSRLTGQELAANPSEIGLRH